MDEEQRAPRKTGLELPPHPFQVASWLLYAALVATYYAVFLAPLGEAERIAAGVVYGALALVTLLGAWFATATDPADPLLAAAEPAPTDAALHWCYRCTKQVHPSSKHCTVCRKCVDVFDRACGARRGAGRSQAPLTSSYAAPRRAPSVPSVRKTTACG